MRKLTVLVSVLLLLFMTGCGTKEDTDVNKQKVKEEIKEVVSEFMEFAEEGDLENTENLMVAGLGKNFSPEVFYTTMTEQYPESTACQEGAKEVADYMLTRLYTNYRVEQIDVSQDLSEVRVLISWEGMNPTTIDTSSMKETIDELVNREYQNNQISYDENTNIYGEENTNEQIRENCFPKVFSEIKKLYESVEQDRMKGVFCFSYITNESWKLTGIYEYMDLMYDAEDKSYNWDFEKAQDDFEQSKQELENAGA